MVPLRGARRRPPGAWAEGVRRGFDASEWIRRSISCGSVAAAEDTVGIWSVDMIGIMNKYLEI